MTEKTLTTENIKPALDALRGELAPWPVVAKKQDRLNTAQLNAANSGITSSLVAQIIANTAAIRALESAITGTGLRALVVATLPAVGTTGILYIVPVTTYDPDTDADVVNYSNEYIWIPVEGGTASEGHYEQVGQTGIVINNGQLTITVNGTSVGTFTANQSGDTTAAITVPTNADYVDRTTDQTVAGVKTFSSTIDGTASKAIADEDGTSIKTGYVNIAGNQTVGGQKDWSNLQTFSYGQIRIKSLSQEIGITPATSIIQYLEFADKNNTQHGKVGLWDYDNGASEIQISILDKYKNGVKDATGTSDTAFLSFGFQYNGVKFLTFSGQINNSVIPLATNSYSLGSSSYQWASVYAQTYFYNGVAWGLDQANAWTGNNTFKSANTNLRLQSTVAETGSTTASSNWMHWIDKNGYQDAYISRDFWNNGADTLRIILSGKRSNGAPSTSGTAVECGIRLDIAANGSKSVNPYTNGDTDLGTSTNKWKTLNGINPGALSLPINANSASYNIDTTNWTTDGSIIAYTPLLDGWIYINARNDDTNGDSFIIFDDGVSSFGTSVFGNKGLPNNGVGLLCLMMPVNKNNGINIRIKSPGIISARFYPCNGNV